MFQRPLVCTNFVDGLQRLVNFTTSFASIGFQQITFLHAIPFPSGQTIPRIDEKKIQSARDRLTVAPQDATKGLQVNVEVQGGRVIDCILNAAKVYKPDLIILGASERGSLEARLFGSTIAELSKRGVAPLLIVRPQLLSTYRNEELELRCRHLFQHLLIPYDDSNAANYTLEKVKQLAQKRPSETLQNCTLCWVAEIGGYNALLESDERESIQKKLVTVQAQLASLGIQVATHTTQGEPIQEILKAANELDISAIACSSDSLGKLIDWSVPSCAGEILHRSWYPVLYFPPAKRALLEA
jgi:nucleotide-binding universal stress UspA family protein